MDMLKEWMTGKGIRVKDEKYKLASMCTKLGWGKLIAKHFSIIQCLFTTDNSHYSILPRTTKHSFTFFKRCANGSN